MAEVNQRQRDQIIAQTIDMLPAYASSLSADLRNRSGLTDSQRQAFENFFHVEGERGWLRTDGNTRATTSFGMKCALGQLSTILHQETGDYISRIPSTLSYSPGRRGMTRRGSRDGLQSMSMHEARGNVTAGLAEAERSARLLRGMTDINDPQLRDVAQNAPAILQAMSVQQIEAWRNGAPPQQSVLEYAMQNNGRVPAQYENARVTINGQTYTGLEAARHIADRERQGTLTREAVSFSFDNRDNARVQTPVTPAPVVPIIPEDEAARAPETPATPTPEQNEYAAEREFPPPPVGNGADAANKGQVVACGVNRDRERLQGLYNRLFRTQENINEHRDERGRLTIIGEPLLHAVTREADTDSALRRIISESSGVRSEAIGSGNHAPVAVQQLDLIQYNGGIDEETRNRLLGRMREIDSSIPSNTDTTTARNVFLLDQTLGHPSGDNDETEIRRQHAELRDRTAALDAHIRSGLLRG